MFDIKKNQDGIEALMKENVAETENRTPFLDAARGSLSNALINLDSHRRELEKQTELKAKKLKEQREALEKAEAEALKAAQAKPAAPAPAAK